MNLYIKIVSPTGLILSALICLHLSVAGGNAASIQARQDGLVFSTWEEFEVDKCASIWLIKRFIDKNAVIKFFPKGELIKEGIPFDTPDAIFRRYHNSSTYESLLKHYELKDPNLIRIGKIIYDIEVNKWEQKRIDESLVIEDAVNQIILNSTSREEVIEKSARYFDSLYEGKAVKE